MQRNIWKRGENAWISSFQGRKWAKKHEKSSIWNKERPGASAPSPRRSRAKNSITEKGSPLNVTVITAVDFFFRSFHHTVRVYRKLKKPNISIKTILWVCSNSCVHFRVSFVVGTTCRFFYSRGSVDWAICSWCEQYAFFDVNSMADLPVAWQPYQNTKKAGLCATLSLH